MGRDLTFDDVKAAYAEGVRRVMISTAVPDIAKQQIGVFHWFNATVNDPIVIQTFRYISLAYVDFDINQAREIIQWARDLGIDIQFHWWDWEDSWNQASQEDKEAACQKALDNFTGFCSCGFYSAYWYWTGYMANTTKYSYVPWWFALYDGIPNLSMGNYPFGGITNPVMKQYKENTYVGGIYCDMNYFEDIPPGVQPPPQQEVIIPQGVYTDVTYDELGKAREIKLSIVG